MWLQKAEQVGSDEERREAWGFQRERETERRRKRSRFVFSPLCSIINSLPFSLAAQTLKASPKLRATITPPANSATARRRLCWSFLEREKKGRRNDERTRLIFFFDGDLIAFSTPSFSLSPSIHPSYQVARPLDGVDGLGPVPPLEALEAGGGAARRGGGGEQV